MMIVVEERNTFTDARRFIIVSAPDGERLQTQLFGFRNSWRSRRRAQRICDRYNKRMGWERSG